MYKQVIIARKDLNMSPGKLSAQVSHGSMAFIMNDIFSNTIEVCKNRFPVWNKNTKTGEIKPQWYRRNDLGTWASQARERGENFFYAKPDNPDNPYGPYKLCEPELAYTTVLSIDNDLYNQWFKGEFTKCILQAKNKNNLLKAKTMAIDLGMEENKDFFLIYDNCHTELEPEENGKTLTVIGFRPMSSDIIDVIGKKFQLYH